MAFASSTIPERIRTARTLRGMSQRDLSRAMLTGQSCVWLWESGAVSPRPSTTLKLANALGVNMLWLTYGEGPMDAAPATTKAPVAPEASASSSSAH